MYKAYKNLIEANVNVLSVKTDAFMIQHEHLERAKSVLTFSNNIGEWRVTKECCAPHACPDYVVVENKLLETIEHTTTRIDITDEWNVDELCEHIINKKRVMIRAKLPGSGKSYVCEHLVNLGYKVLFVCPTNKLAQKYKESGLTINKFYGIGFANNEVKEEGEIKIKGFDSSEYDVIVFDEIYFSNVRMLARIRKFSLDNPEKIIVATGDTSQLPPILPYSNTKDYVTYADECINNIFPYEIYLKENKRLKTQEDKDKLERIYNDIFNINIEPEITIKKYFKHTKSLTTSNKSISDMNDTAEIVSKHTRKHLNKTDEYEIGEVLVCRQYLNCKLGKFNVNFEYKIIGYSYDTIEIENLATGEEHELPKDIIRKHFIFNYCSTCHSTQGQTIDENITIYDWKFYYVTREWLWTAITRATSLDNVYFYEYVEPELNRDLIYAYFKRRVEGYKKQDVERSNERLPKEVINNYITPEWLMNSVNKICPSCNNMLYIRFRDGNTYTNITAQRSDNSLYHTLDNIKPMCRMCNCSLSNRVTD